MVTLNSWVYMVCGVLALFQLQGARFAGQKTAVALGAVLLVVVGFGLFMRRRWARWVAVGMSLVTWLLGSIGLAMLVVLAFRAYGRAHNASFGAFLGVLLVLGVVGVILWLNKRLYEYLTSEEGREDFLAPDDEKHLTSKSAAAYVAYLIVVTVLTSPAMKRASSDFDLAVFRDAAARAEQSRRERKPPDGGATAAERPARRSVDSDGVSRLQMQAPAARVVEPVERVNASQRTTNRVEDQDRRRVMDEIKQEIDRLPQRSVPDSSPQRTPPTVGSKDAKPDFRVLRCRDSAGTIVFTQNYCPAGSRPVE